MWNDITQPDTPQMAVWFMRIICWIRKATSTHSKYAIRIALPIQIWLHERASMIRLYVRCLSCEVMAAVDAVCWDMTPCQRDLDSHCFEKIWWVHLQCWNADIVGHFDPWKWKQCFMSKRSEPIIRWLVMFCNILFLRRLTLWIICHRNFCYRPKCPL